MIEYLGSTAAVVIFPPKFSKITLNGSFRVVELVRRAQTAIFCSRNFKIGGYFLHLFADKPTELKCPEEYT